MHLVLGRTPGTFKLLKQRHATSLALLRLQIITSLAVCEPAYFSRGLSLACNQSMHAAFESVINLPTANVCFDFWQVQETLAYVKLALMSAMRSNLQIASKNTMPSRLQLPI
eukprot:4193410-Pleurochrysis_carterae.AAC.1